ncbi:MAG: hypothetical protein Q9159_000693 [Coniocarpon cinnabarinum]
MNKAKRPQNGFKKVQKLPKGQKRKREDVDTGELQRRVDELDTSKSFEKFTDLPLSPPTLAGLEASHFTTPTTIQQRTLPLALHGRDILGAAQTGSGKTLAFLIPVLENLYRAQHVGQDAGLGAMIISPTRELAIQIFNVLRKIGQQGHMFAAGLVIGGKSLMEEREALARMNIVVCTPGRMLQHLSQTAMFAVDGLKMLVLDEADRIMDMGFQRDVDALIEYLPPPGMRQTMLFSATQTKRVSDLARLSLKDPEYISVHESSSSATPSSLQQNYTLTPLPEKLSTLWSFLLSAKKTKLLVFLSSGKQVRHVYESFRHLQPGIPLLHLHGRQKQTARLEITERFSQARYACLFATDVAARGLDFPAVDWVVQVDCPEDADTYIHRVGRTARYSRTGRAVLFLDPVEEEGFISRLEAKKVPVERINVKMKKQKSIQQSMQGLCFKFPDLKYLGQKAFVSYVRSLHVQRDRTVFPDLTKYDLEGYAASMGLPGAPRIKFTRGDAEAAKKAKNAPRRGMSPEPDEKQGSDVENGPKQQKGVRTKYDRMFERKNQDVLAPHYAAMLDADDSARNGTHNDDDTPNGNPDDKDNPPPLDAGNTNDDLFAVKSRFRPTSPTTLASPHQDPRSTNPTIRPTSKRQKKLLRTTAGAAKLAHKQTNTDPLQSKSTHLIFDDDTGEAKPLQVFVEETAEEKEAAERARRREEFVEKEREGLKSRDVADREVEREKRRAKREKRKVRERGEREDHRGMDDGDEDGFESESGDGGGREDGDGSDDDEDGGVKISGIPVGKDQEMLDILGDLYGDDDDAPISAHYEKAENGAHRSRKEVPTSKSDAGDEGVERASKRRKKDTEREPAADVIELEKAAMGLLE